MMSEEHCLFIFVLFFKTVHGKGILERGRNVIFVTHTMLAKIKKAYVQREQASWIASVYDLSWCRTKQMMISDGAHRSRKTTRILHVTSSPTFGSVLHLLTKNKVKSKGLISLAHCW